MKTISSRQNPWFKRIQEAIREHAEAIVLESPKSAADAIAAGWTPIAVVARADRAALAASLGTNVVLFAPELFDQLATTKTSQGILGMFERPHASAEQLFHRHDAIVVALDGVQDPGNVGTIVRLAAAFDAAGMVLLPGCADPFAPKAVRASAGAILGVPCVAMEPAALIARGWPLFAADAHGDAIDPPERRAVLLFGSEGSGLSPEIAAAARPIAVPMSSRVESLNVAASAAILLARSYALRQKR